VNRLKNANAIHKSAVGRLEVYKREAVGGQGEAAMMRGDEWVSEHDVTVRRAADDERSWLGHADMPCESPGSRDTEREPLFAQLELGTGPEIDAFYPEPHAVH